VFVYFRTKIFLTDSQRNMLKEAFDAGMTRYSSAEELAVVDRLAMSTGLTSKRVKVNVAFDEFSSKNAYIHES
jgi:hypothetical protein